MGIVQQRPDWWIDPGEGSSAPGAGGGAGAMAVVSAQVRPMGPHSAFITRPMAYACLNCGEWIHPGEAAWYDPDLDRSVCARCWPESVIASTRH
jgi:hypothetical protein